MSVKRVGFVFDAGPEVGYGHAMRSVRLAAALGPAVEAVFFPLSDACGRFLAERRLRVATDDAFPPVMISDMSDTHPLIDALASAGCRHIGIRDLGLGQGEADVIIDGAITRAHPYPSKPDLRTFLGPRYMVVDPRTIVRRPREREVLITLGGGSSSDYARALGAALTAAGFTVSATRGFESAGARPNSPSESDIRWISSEEEIAAATARSRLAITTAGVTLYELLGAGVPAIALSVDEYQLRTARAFDDRNAVTSAGLMAETGPDEVVERAKRVHDDPALMARLVEQARRLVDGKGLFRVTEIVRSELCPTA